MAGSSPYRINPSRRPEVIETSTIANALQAWRYETAGLADHSADADLLYARIRAILPPDPKPVLVTFDFADDDYLDSDSGPRTPILTCPWCKSTNTFAEVNIAEDWCVLDEVTADADGTLGCVTKSPSGDYYSYEFVCTECEKPVEIDIELDYC
jgi:hypothetical protein